MSTEIDKFNPVALWDEDGQDPYNVDPCMTGAMVRVPEGKYVRLKDHLKLLGDEEQRHRDNLSHSLISEVITEEKLHKAEVLLRTIRDICEDFPNGIPVDHVKNIKGWINTYIVRCDKCDDTGDVHRIDGEWLGRCDCLAGRYKA